MAYTMAAATGTRAESERPAEWKDDETEEEREEDPAVAAA